MPSSSFLSPLSTSRIPRSRFSPPRLTCPSAPVPARVLRIAFHVKHGELMRVICWPRARLRVLRSSWYNLKPARAMRRGCKDTPDVKKSAHRSPRLHFSPRFFSVSSSFFFSLYFLRPFDVTRLRLIVFCRIV